MICIAVVPMFTPKAIRVSSFVVDIQMLPVTLIS